MKRRLLTWVLLSAIGCGKAPVVTPPTPPTIVTSELPAAKLREGYDQKIAVSGGVTPYAFTIITGALPAGLSFQGSTGQITGIPTEPGHRPFTVRVVDAEGQSVEKALTLVVTPDPLVIRTSTLADVKEGEMIRVPLRAEGGVLPYHFSIKTGTIPAGLSLSAEGVISGAATFAGPYDFGVHLEDAEQNRADRSYQLLVAPLVPMITTTTLSRARFGDPFEERLLAGGGHAPYDWSLVTGSLPRGIGLDATGTLAGSPSESGVFSFTVRVQDARGRTDMRSFSLSVLAPLVITTHSLPPIILNRRVDVAMTAQGGLRPYTWSLNGALPANLSFSADGRLSGVPVVGGDYPITVRVQDAQGILRSVQFTLHVNDQIVYTETPMQAFPPVCTSTRVSYTTYEINVGESFTILDVTVRLDIDFNDPQNGNDKLKVLLFSPEGRQVALCGMGSGVPGGPTCDGNRGVHTVFPTAATPDTEMRVLRGINGHGTWRLAVGVVRPTIAANGMCQQTGTINTVEVTFRDDRSPNPYVLLSPIRTNNLVIDPWVRVTGGDPAGENELYLSATLWTVGPNGVPEAGKGDDVPDPTHVFTWAAAGLPTGTTISPDGHVVSGRRTGQGNLTADDGQGHVLHTPLLVTPPDWNELVRVF